MIFRDSIITNFEFIPGQQKEGEEGISLFWTGTKCVYHQDIFPPTKKVERKGRDLGEVNLFTLSLSRFTKTTILPFLLFFFFLNRAFQEAAN